MASGTCPRIVPSGELLPQDDTHFKHHSWLHHAGQFRGVDDLTVFSTQYTIVTSFNVMLSNAIFEIAPQYMVKSLRNEMRDLTEIGMKEYLPPTWNKIGLALIWSSPRHLLLVVRCHAIDPKTVVLVVGRQKALRQPVEAFASRRHVPSMRH